MKLIPLTKAQLIQLRDNKYTFGMNSDGSIRKITYDDLCVDEETLNKIKEKFPFDKKGNTND